MNDSQRAAEAAYQLDEEMSSIREEIQEAQRLFSHGRGKSDDVYYRTLLKKAKERRQGMKVAIVHNKEAKTIEVTERLNAL